MGLATTIDRWSERARGLTLGAAELLTTGVIFNPFARGFREDPYPFYRKLRETDPFHRCLPASGWVLSRYDDVLAVLRDARFGADERSLSRYPRMAARLRRAGLPDPYDDGRGSMLRLDPPDHTRLRALVSKAFTGRAVERMRPRVEGILKELLERRPTGGGPLALVRELASPLPVRVIAEMLGVPPEDHERFRHWSDEIVRTLGEATLEDRHASERAGAELGEYFAAVCDARRRAPREDLISALVAAEEVGDRLTQKELLSTLVLLLVAGNETTTNLISNALLALLRHPRELAKLRLHPERIGDALEELLRYDSPVQLTSRAAREDVALAGKRIRKGEQVVLLLGSANRDDAIFPEPDRLDLERPTPRHLAFGHGLHFCLGAQLARLEATLALEALITRFPRLALLDQPIAWSGSTVLRGPKELWLEV
jgi:pimeloyl-[acyl-carrier protein] synthase